MAAQDGQKMWISILSSGQEECSKKGLRRNLEINHTRRDMSTHPRPAAMDKGKQTHRLCSQVCSKQPDHEDPLYGTIKTGHLPARKTLQNKSGYGKVGH